VTREKFRFREEMKTRHLIMRSKNSKNLIETLSWIFIEQLWNSKICIKICYLHCKFVNSKTSFTKTKSANFFASLTFTTIVNVTFPIAETNNGNKLFATKVFSLTSAKSYGPLNSLKVLGCSISDKCFWNIEWDNSLFAFWSTCKE
jgi:hypothetical protein